MLMLLLAACDEAPSHHGDRRVYRYHVPVPVTGRERLMVDDCRLSGRTFSFDSFDLKFWRERPPGVYAVNVPTLCEPFLKAKK
jgi:hypothetical protein